MTVRPGDQLTVRLEDFLCIAMMTHHLKVTYSDEMPVGDRTGSIKVVLLPVDDN